MKKIIKNTTPIAKKIYTCECCGKNIKPGDKYISSSVLSNGKISTERYCCDKCLSGEKTSVCQRKIRKVGKRITSKEQAYAAFEREPIFYLGNGDMQTTVMLNKDTLENLLNSKEAVLYECKYDIYPYVISEEIDDSLIEAAIEFAYEFEEDFETLEEMYKRNNKFVERIKEILGV